MPKKKYFYSQRTIYIKITIKLLITKYENQIKLIKTNCKVYY